MTDWLHPGEPDYPYEEVTVTADREPSTEARRPWCLPCVERRGVRTFAEFSGVACAVHHEMLDEQSREALRLAARDQKPKGGRITTVTGQIWAVRHFLRQQRAPNTVEATWRRDDG